MPASLPQVAEPVIPIPIPEPAPPLPVQIIPMPSSPAGRSTTLGDLDLDPVPVIARAPSPSASTTTAATSALGAGAKGKKGKKKGKGEVTLAVLSRRTCSGGSEHALSWIYGGSPGTPPGDPARPAATTTRGRSRRRSPGSGARRRGRRADGTPRSGRRRRRRSGGGLRRAGVRLAQPKETASQVEDEREQEGVGEGGRAAQDLGWERRLESIEARQRRMEEMLAEIARSLSANAHTRAKAGVERAGDPGRVIRADGAMQPFLGPAIRQSLCWSIQILVRARLHAGVWTFAALQIFRDRESTAPVSSAGEQLPLALRHAKALWDGLWLIAPSEDWPCLLSSACRSRLGFGLLGSRIDLQCHCRVAWLATAPWPVLGRAADCSGVRAVT
ncbi:hypothetical protein NUW54_g12143 [Trametes sanguinea]|uniref:Uncharacterized protein n=1 Tax=Trametes sanguinea TaxID=158606 RepID=A0ACC1N179_9APHY|nr:hypothetical protein NUW54_g12143 [Trametes sanguinea]